MQYQVRSYAFLRQPIALLAALLVIFILASSANAQYQMRTWTSSTGKQVEATFKEFRDGSVILTDQQGKDGKFSTSQFSEPDQKYIREINLYNKQKEKWDKDPKKDPVKKPEPVMPKDPRGTPATPGEVAPVLPPSTDDPMTKPLMAFVKRTWKDVKGRSIDGRLFNAKGDKVYIQNADPEKVVAVTIKNLDKKDQDYVATQLKGLGRTDLLLGLGLIEANAVATGDLAAQPGNASAPAGSPMNPGAAPAIPIFNIEMPANVIPPNASVNSVIQSILDNMKKRK